MYIRDVRTNSAAFHPEECYVDVSFSVVQSSKKCQRLVSPNVARSTSIAGGFGDLKLTRDRGHRWRIEFRELFDDRSHVSGIIG